MEFYDIQEQTKYQIKISKPTKMEDLSDLFVNEEELHDLVGPQYYSGTGERTITLDSVITAAVMEWAEKLEASGKKTLLIDDEELLDVLKRGCLTDHTENDNRYGRSGDRICFARQWKRTKKKATKGDVTILWSYLSSGFQMKFNVWPSHIPRYDRNVRLFKAFQKIVGWRRVRSQIYDKSKVKFFRQIWDNPEEYIK